MIEMTDREWFGLVAVAAMITTYALEQRSHWLTLAFAFSCSMASVFGFLEGSWQFGVAEAIWTIVAFFKWKARVMVVWRESHPAKVKEADGGKVQE